MLFFLSTALIAQPPTSNRQLADQYMSNFEYDKAATIYDKIYDKDPFGTYPNYLKCLLALRNYDAAEKLVKNISKKNPENTAYAVDLGFVFESKGDINKAKQTYDKSIKGLQPDQGQIMNLANAFFSHQNWDYALATYTEGKKLMRNIYSFNFETAEVYFQKQEYEKMIDEYLNAVAENQAYLQSVQNILQSRIGNDPDNSRSTLLRQALLRRTQRDPDQSIFSEMLIWLFVQQKDFESAFIQAKALDKRLREDGSRVMNIGSMSEANLDYPAAINCYKYVVDKGKNTSNYITARMQLLEVRNKSLTGEGSYTQDDLLKLESEYKITLDELGRDATTAPLISGLAHLEAFYLDNTDSAIVNLETAIDYPGISKAVQAKCKLELGDIYLFTGNVWDSDLLYAQVDKTFKNDPLGQEAKFRGARLDYFRGDFQWAEAQLGVLKTATSQLIANDALALALLISDNPGPDSSFDALTVYSKADLLAYRNRKDEALHTIDSLIQTFPDHSLIQYSLYKKAMIMDGKRNYAEEDSLLRKLGEQYDDGVLADDALFHRAELYEKRFKDKSKAMELYQDLLTKFPGSLYVVDARKKFRALRGDALN
ncbi:MAG: tetratricopeptide repeat protein [Bacteroidetes bacterium]|nr:tetratricopeptide repeat protein [Bacteroidota bacterium]